MADPIEHALIIEIPRSSLPDADVVSEIVSLEAELAAALNDLGAVDGHDLGLMLGPETGGGLTGASIYIYGQSAEAMFAAIQPVLAANAMSADSTVRMREGKPGTEEKRIEMQSRIPPPGVRLQ